MQEWQFEEGETLRVKTKALSIEDVGKLVSSIEENESITAIDIRERELNDESCGLLMAAALRCSRLRRLHLAGNSIGEVGAQNLAVNLQALSSVLIHLDLSQNRLGPSCCKELASSFFQQQSPTAQPSELILDLSDNALLDQGVVEIVRALSRATSEGVKLKVRLMLRQVFCSDQGLMSLASVLQCLTGLHVAYNPISAMGLGLMCKVLTEQIFNKRNNNRLRELDLSSLQRLDGGSRMADSEGKSLLQRFDALSSMLVKTSAVREFVFAGNFLGDDGAQKIANGIADNKYHNLERLGLSSNEIGAKGVDAICRAMRKMADNGKGLRVLELDSNRLDDECARKLGDAISWSPNLSRLLLSRNNIGDIGGTALAHGIACQLETATKKEPKRDGWPGALIELDLDFNEEIADKAISALADAAIPKISANAGPFSYPWGLERLRIVGTGAAKGRAERGAECLANAIRLREQLASEAIEVVQQCSQPWATNGWVPSALKVFGIDLETFGVEKQYSARRRASHRTLRRKWPMEGRESLTTSLLAPGDTLLEGRHPVWSGEHLRAARRRRPRGPKAKKRSESSSSSSTYEDGGRLPWEPPKQDRSEVTQLDELSASEHRRRLSESSEQSKQVFAYLPCQDAVIVTEAPKARTEATAGFFGQQRKSLASLVGGISSLFGAPQPEVLEMDYEIEEHEVLEDAVGDWFEDDSDIRPRVQHVSDHNKQPHGGNSIHRGMRQRQGAPDRGGGSDTSSTLSSVCGSAVGSSEYGSAVGSNAAPSSSRYSSAVGSGSRQGGREGARGDGLLLGSGGNLGAKHGSVGREGKEFAAVFGVGDVRAEGVSTSTRIGVGIGDGREERDYRHTDENLRSGLGFQEGRSHQLVRGPPNGGKRGGGFGVGDSREERDFRCSGGSGLGFGDSRGSGLGFGDSREERDLRPVGEYSPASQGFGGCRSSQLGNDYVAGDSQPDRVLGDGPKNSSVRKSHGPTETSGVSMGSTTSHGGDNEVWHSAQRQLSEDNAAEIERLRRELSNAADPNEVQKLKADLRAHEGQALEYEQLKADTQVMNKQLREREAELEALRAQLVVAKASSPVIKASSPKAGPLKEPKIIEDTPTVSPKAKAGVTKGKGVGKGGPPGKAPPKSAPPPPRGKAKAGAVDQAKANSIPKAASAAETPFGRKIHFQKPMYELGEACVWGELTGQGEHETEFSPELLAALFAQQQSDQKPKGRWSVASATKKLTGVSILDGKRAQNMAIVLSRLPCSTEELCNALMDCDFDRAALSVDDIELVQNVLPTDGEISQLQQYTDRNKVEELRDIEQKVLPFCAVEKAAIRLNIMRVAVTHGATHQTLITKLRSVKQACEEVGRSDRFRKLLKTILHMGNYINAAKCDESSMKGFAIESLPVLCTFKTGQVSSLHFLCLTLRKDAMFLRDLKVDFSKVPEAAKLKLDHLEGLVNTFAKDRVFVEAQIEVFKGREGHHRLVALRQELQEEESGLKAELQATQAAAVDVQKFFGVATIKGSMKMPPVEDFMDHIAKFLEQFAGAWNEIERNPAKWQKFGKSEKHQEREDDRRLSVQSGDAIEIIAAVNETNETSGARVPRVRPRLAIKRAKPRFDAEKEQSAVDSTSGLAASSDLGPSIVPSLGTLQRSGTVPADLGAPVTDVSDVPPLRPHAKTDPEQVGFEKEVDTALLGGIGSTAPDKKETSAQLNSRAGKEVEATDSSTTAPLGGTCTTIASKQNTNVGMCTGLAADGEASLTASCVEETVADLRSGGVALNGAIRTSKAVSPPREEDLEPFSGNDPSLLASEGDTDSIGPWDSASQVALATPWPRTDTHTPSPEITEATTAAVMVPPREAGDTTLLSNTIEATSARARPVLQTTEESPEPRKAKDLNTALPNTTDALVRPARSIGTLAEAAAAKAGHVITEESKAIPTKVVKTDPLVNSVNAEIVSTEPALQSHTGNGTPATETSPQPMPTMQDLQKRKSFVAALDKRFRIVADSEKVESDSGDAVKDVKTPTLSEESPSTDVLVAASTHPASNGPIANKEHDVIDSSQVENLSEEEF